MTGKVILIGAGPGDPELITVKAIRFLRKADIVLFDRLVSEEILEAYANPDAELFLVGKEGCGNTKSFPQKEIDRMLVHYALDGKLVVRLKGGDVAFFSNVLNELRILNRFGVPYEIVPGITAASGASAYSGIPLTARGYARGVRFLTYSRKHSFENENWQELAQTEDTLVFYMAGEAWQDLAKRLIQYGIAENKGLAIIAQATTPFQKVTTFLFSELQREIPVHEFVSPSLIVIGSVVALHQEFAWLPETSGAGNYFPSADYCKKLHLFPNLTSSK